MTMERKLLIIEPWICHYEVIPSVIDSACKYYSEFELYSQYTRSMGNILNKEQVKYISVNSIVELATKKPEKHLNVDIWMNTSHIHGSDNSIDENIAMIMQLTKRYCVGTIYMVIHNKNDIDFSCKLKSKIISCQIHLIFLSYDVQHKFEIDNKFSCKVFQPYILNCSPPSSDKDDYKKSSLPIKLCIAGMCREGKRFNELRYFKSLIKQGIVEFLYTGWIPKGSLKASGLFNAVNKGLVSQTCGSQARVKDIQMHEFISQADAIIDLKSVIYSERCLVSSGNVGLSLALEKPLIVHINNYPSYHCYRYHNMEQLIDWLSHPRVAKNDLLMQKKMLLRNKKEIIHRNKLLFIKEMDNADSQI